MRAFVCELTPHCNLECAFCYNPWRAPGAFRPSQLSPENWVKILLPTLREGNASWLAFAGGEPLLYPGLSRLIKMLADEMPELTIGLATNGTLITARRLAELARAGLRYVEVPLFTTSRERYRAITGKDQLDAVHNTLLQTKEYGLPLTVACTLLADGVEEFEDVLSTAFALGADAIALNPFTPTGHGTSSLRRFSLSREQLAKFLSCANRAAASWSIPITVTLPVEDCVLHHDDYLHLRFSGCECGTRKWVIDPEGWLRICEQNSTRLGNLANHSFSELATHPYVQAFRNQTRNNDCPTCPSFRACGGGCRVNKEFPHKHQELEDTFERNMA